MSQSVVENLFSELDADSRRFDRPGSQCDDGREIYIYGAGNVGRDLARLLREKKIPVAGFIDQRSPASHCEGLPLLRAEATPPAARANGHVLVAIFNRDTDMPPIFRFLRELGYGRVTSFLEVHRHFPHELGDRFWLTDLPSYRAQKEDCLRAADLWSDEASRALFAQVLRFRFTGRYEELAAPDLHDQYFPEGLPPWPGPLRLIDCGAYDGDTLRALLARRQDVEAVAAFEPDPVNFSRLSEWVRARELSATLALYPCGVGSSTKQVRFSSHHGEASRVAGDGDSWIQCVALDQALPGFRPTLVKMDIEGSELDALLGARRTIEQSRPGLAISVYHRADHLWKIPLLMHDWLGSGRHFLRAHAYNAFELIYYWMP